MYICATESTFLKQEMIKNVTKYKYETNEIKSHEGGGKWWLSGDDNYNKIFSKKQHCTLDFTPDDQTLLILVKLYILPSETDLCCFIGHKRNAS